MNSKKLKKKNVVIKVDKNILLKTLFVEDVSKSHVSWLNDYNVTKFTEQKYINHTLKSVKSYVKQKYDSESDLLLGIFFSKLHIGNIKLGSIRFQHMSAEVSYLIGEKNFWSKGIASKCVETVVRYAIKNLDLKKINAGYYENNIGSAKVLQKCGFVVEGIKHSEVVFEKKRIQSILVGYVSKFSKF